MHEAWHDMRESKPDSGCKVSVWRQKSTDKSQGSQSSPPAKISGRIALIACRVLEAEIASLTRDATHVVHRQFFEIGLHDQPTALRARLAEAIARAEAEPLVATIVLVYGLCGLALVDLAPRRCPLVVPRAHDCITLFLGGKERYAAAVRADPGLYWYTPGWNRGRRAPGPEREAQLRAAYTAKFDAEDAEALLAMDRECFAQHIGAAYVDLNLPGDAQHHAYAKRCAASLGWSLTSYRGDPTFVRDLLHGPWDAPRFLVVPPGRKIAISVDDRVIKAVPVA
jgi:hypothetical protein